MVEIKEIHLAQQNRAMENSLYEKLMYEYKMYITVPPCGGQYICVRAERLSVNLFSALGGDREVVG
jgi:hypothetical protein